MLKKLLIADDVTINRTLLLKALQGQYEVIEAADGNTALALALQAASELSAILLDIHMPGLSGYEVLQGVRENPAAALIPVIIVTGSEDEVSRKKALTLGANDFILKPFNPDIIRHCVKNNIALYETALKLNALQTDKLTGLYSREAFFERVAELVAQQEPGYYLLSSFDIDNFKLINSELGTAEGDSILRQIGRIVQEDMAQLGGIGCRISGDNFAVLLPAAQKGTSILRIVESNRFAFSAKQMVVLSVGRYLITDLSLAPSECYDRAHLAKQSVKGRYDEHVAYFDNAMLDRLIRNRRILADISNALEERQFEVWYQPQLNHITGALAGAEALMRWRHPEKGFVSPAEVIPVFEENGFIYELDKYIWDEVCRQLRKWLDEGRQPVPVSVNISRYDLFRPDFFETLTGLPKKYNLPPGLLRLEITESAFAHSTKLLVQMVRQLIDYGFVVEIDDFGSGYSSLNTLKSVPAQVVKLDMRFLEDDNDGERGGNILGSVVRMTKWLGMSVIAEGVESKAQADYLASVGCSYIQGYYYSKPLPVEAFEEYCSKIGKEQRLLTMSTVENLDNNAFWDPKSMDTLIFNSFVGAACIFEYFNRKIELLRANQRFTAILGDGTLSIEDTLRLDWLSCLAPESRQLVRSVLKRSGETKQEYTDEYVFLNIPGAPPKTYLRSTMRVIAVAGERLLVYCTSENITAQREAEENEKKALLHKELAAGQLQAILDNVDVGVVASVFQNGIPTFLFSNDKFYDILGYTREQFETKIRDPFETFAPEEQGRIRKLFRDHASSGEPGIAETYMLRADGQRRLIREAISTCRFAGIAEPVQLAIFRDVTAEREAAQKELRSAEQIRAILGGVGSGIIATVGKTAEKAELLFSNDRYYELLGYTREQYEAEVKEYFTLLHPDDRESIRKHFAASFASDEPQQLEFRVLCRDGSLRWLRVNVSEAHLTGIELPVRLCIFNDMTPEREAERKLLQTDEQLRFLVSMSHELLAQEDTEHGIHAVLKQLRERFIGERSYIYEINPAAKLAGNTYEVCAEGVRSEMERHQQVPLQRLKHWDTAFEKDGYYAVDNVAALDESRAEEREELLKMGITSLFVLPLRRNGQLIGALGVNNSVRQLRHYDRLAALADYLSVMLTRRDLAKRIRKDNRELNAVMNDMPGGLIRVQVLPDGSILPIFINEGFARLVSMDEKELRRRYGENALLAVHPDDAALVRGIAAELLRTNETHRSRYRVLTGSGSYITVSTVERATKDEAGNLYINIYFTDATAETQKQELQKALMDNMPCGAGIYEFKDGQMSLTYQNKVYWELVGLHEETFPDEKEMSAVHPDDIPIIMQELSAAIEQHRDVHCSIRLRHLTRGYRNVELLGRVVFREDGSFSIYATFASTDGKEVTYQQVLPHLLSAMMESSADMFFYKDKELRYLCASKAVATLTGHSDVSELIGKTDEDIFEPALAEKYRRDDEALLAGKESVVNIQEIIPSQNGEPRYANTSKYVLYDGEGQQIGIFGVSRDTTLERTTASRFELLTNSIPGGIAVYEGSPHASETVRITYFSDGLCRLLGYSREQYEQLLRDNPFTLIAADELDRLVRQVCDHKGKAAEYSFRAQCCDGSYKWISARVALGEPHSGNVTVTAVFFDITESREASERLRMSEEINRLAIEQSMGIVCRYDVATRQLSVPENVDAIFEADSIETDIPYKPVREGRVSPDTAAAYTAFYESILNGERKGLARFKRSSTQGWRWVEAHFTTIFSGLGQPVTAVISIFDVTESIEKDAAYKKWKQSIHEKQPETYSLFRCSITKATILEATEGLLLPPQAHDKCLTSFEKRTASYADNCVLKEDRQRYLAFMNRDAMLLRYSQGRRSDAIEYRERLLQGGFRWLRLSVDYVDSPYSSEVEAFLLFENIDEAKKKELAILELAEKDQLTGVYNRSSFIARVEQELLKHGAQAALFILDIDGFKQINDTLGHAAGDEALQDIGRKLRETFRGDDLIGRLGGDEFMVLMQNVTYAGAARERAALLCALLHRAFSLELQLSVSIGIALYPEHGADFETLYRKADAALYQVKRNGKDSYALYQSNMAQREYSSETVAIEKSTDATSGKPKQRLLIVDDSEASLSLLAGIFKNEYRVETAQEGTAALTRLTRAGGKIDAVLLDLVMPDMDGFTLLQKMRESPILQKIPVLVISGLSEREGTMDAIRAGASDYIAKPVDAEILKLRVASAISKAENERLRAQNQYLAMQSEEAKRLAEARAHSEELSTALHAAERADLAKSQFLSSMSHEIRTPLNAVIGFNAIAKSEMSEAKTEEERKQVSMRVLDYLTKSELASRHLLTIINDVLDMSAIESGKLKVDDSPFDFRGLITSLTVMFFSQAKGKGVDFEVYFDKPTEEWFSGDQLRINQVLTNLLSNAVKFTPEGGSVTLTIRESSLDESCAGFSFEVSDTGIGMSQEYLEHIWTPFQQAEASISRRFGGSGLGLSITKNLVELMGGTIAVESKSGVGSTFTVGLTLKRTEQPQRQVSVDFSRIRALVVDDDYSTCDYIRRLFDRCGAACRTFTSGREAVNAFVEAKQQKTPYNVCLVDWRMPKMDGFETISEIRRVSPQELPIVVVTAYDFNEVAQHAESLGINRFISKPLFQSSLFDLLATIGGQQTEHTAENKQQFDFGGRRVMLVEDNIMNMEVARHNLLAANLTVDSAWNGQEAIDLFAASAPGSYAAILMDIHMPGIDGYHATREIRATDRPDAKSIPILAMTADVFAEDIEQAHNAGMNDHIAKPIETRLLYDKLAAYLGL